MSDALVELRDVSLRFAGVGEAPGPEVLRGVDLSVAAGESVAVLGPSGSGKSTLLAILGTLLRPSSGEVFFEKKSLEGQSDDELAHLRNARIGFVFQLHHLLPQCSALENVMVPTLVHAAGASARAELLDRARNLFERVGLAERMDHRPAQLSGGERQRVALVRALINKPGLLLADEPTGALDARSADHVSELLIEIQSTESVALVTVTHAERLAERMQRVLQIEDGRLAARQVAG